MAFLAWSLQKTEGVVIEEKAGITGYYPFCLPRFDFWTALSRLDHIWSCRFSSSKRRDWCVFSTTSASHTWRTSCPHRQKRLIGRKLRICLHATRVAVNSQSMRLSRDYRRALTFEIDISRYWDLSAYNRVAKWRRWTPRTICVVVPFVCNNPILRISDRSDVDFSNAGP